MRGSLGDQALKRVGARQIEFTSSSFLVESASDAATKFAGDEVGKVYSRSTNPTVRGFELRLAALGESEYAVATASGISAILALCVTHLREGDHVLCPRYIFGTVSLFENTLGKFGVDITVVSPTQANAWREAATTKTRLWFLRRHRIR